MKLPWKPVTLSSECHRKDDSTSCPSANKKGAEERIMEHIESLRVSCMINFFSA